jgi:cytidylate kinase
METGAPPRTATLIAFSGLSGTGRSTIARRLAERIGLTNGQIGAATCA